MKENRHKERIKKKKKIWRKKIHENRAAVLVTERITRKTSLSRKRERNKGIVRHPFAN